MLDNGQLVASQKSTGDLQAVILRPIINENDFLINVNRQNPLKQFIQGCRFVVARYDY